MDYLFEIKCHILNRPDKAFLFEINSEFEIPEETSFPTVNTVLTGVNTAPNNPEPKPLKNPPKPLFFDNFHQYNKKFQFLYRMDLHNKILFVL